MRIYTDGASSPDKTGGWAWAYSRELNAGGFAEQTTNQRMEVTAAIEALKHFHDRDIVIVSDSRYLVDCINKRWYVKWRKNGWKNSTGDPVMNKDLWEELLNLLQGRDIKFEWVRGHGGHPMNDLADSIAVGYKKEGQNGKRSQK